MSKDLFLIIPGFFYIGDYQKALYYGDLPLGTLQLSAYLRKKENVNSQIVDLRVEGEKNENLSQLIPDERLFMEAVLDTVAKYDIQDYLNIGINCYTSFQYLQTDLIAKILRKAYPDKNIIVGGYHPTAVPEDFTYENSPFDYVIRGEGESKLSELFRSGSLKRQQRHDKTRVIDDHNCVNVDSLPFPDYELYLAQYPFKDKFKFELYASRGCPYQCAFCATNYKFRSFRFQKFKDDFERLCEIVEEYNKNRLKISFADQSFDRIKDNERILEYIIQNNLQDRIDFSCQCRVETFANAMHLIDLYRKANVVIGFGFESASKKILREMHKTKKPRKYVRIMKKILDEYKDSEDVYCRLNLLAGFPGESRRTFNKTIHFIEKHALHRNIQISPTLFSNYPNVFVYQNMERYERKYGTKFIKEWWKLKSNPLKTSVPERPSKKYPKKQLIGDYKGKYLPILKISKRNTFLELHSWKTFLEEWLSELPDNTT